MAGNLTTKEKIDSSKLLKEAKELQKIKVRWGIRGAQNAKIMFWNEYGTDNIPERPAFRLTFNSKKTHQEIAKATNFAIDQVLKGKKAKDAAKAIGEVGLSQLRKVFSSNIQPANAESTIKRKGVGKNTLYDRGGLFRALDYEVV